MTTSIQEILNELSSSIIKKGYAIEGLDLSYVDSKEKHLEIFTYSTQKYEDAVRAGFEDKGIGSLLLSTETFEGNSTILYENRFLNIPESTGTKDDKATPDFKEFSNIFSGTSSATHQKWINHYKKHKINGVYFFVGRRRKDDFDLVLFGVVNGDNKKKIKAEIRPIINTFLNKLNDFAIVFEKLRQHRKEIASQAVRAAISQVMARNTAHNIASHVLAQLTDGEFLSKEENKEWKCKSYIPKFETDNRIIYQIAFLISYIKDRMEYLGDVTLGIPSMQANKKLSEVQKELDKVWLLLDHISGLSEFRYTIDFCADDKPIVDSNSGNLIPENDLTIAMTNDILGMQALFNIIENVIRNTAKHNQSKPDNKEDKEKRITTFYVNFIDYDADYYEVEIYDDVPVSGNKKFDVTEESVEKEAEYRSKTNTNTGEDISNIDWLVYSMNCNINCSVLDEDNKLRGHSLGILEMEASAAYLRKMDIIDIENDEYDVTFDKEKKSRGDKLNILKAFKKEIKDKNGKNAKTYLAYRIFINKPKEYLFVGFENLITDAKNIETLNKLGVDFISTDDFKKKLEDGTVYHHQFVFHKADFKPTPEQKTQLPLRIIKLEEANQLVENLKTGNFAQIEEQVWSIWFEKIKGDYKTVNVMTSYQEQYHKQGNPFNLCYCDHSKEWDKRVKEFNDNNIHFLEPLSSAAQQKLPSIKSNHELADYIYELKGEAIKYKLFEAAISKVLVIDERIQRFSDTSYISTPNKDIFSKSHVTIPGSEKLKLDADNYDLEFKKRLENYIDTEVKTNTYKFMLIHFGILERLFKENPSEIEVNLKKWSEQTRVVVTSGRGRPKELLPPEICFVNLSSVLRVFTQTRNKYSINYLLNQARK